MGMLITRYSGRAEPAPEPHKPGPLRLPSDAPAEGKGKKAAKPEAPAPAKPEAAKPAESKPEASSLEGIDDAELEALTAPSAAESK